MSQVASVAQSDEFSKDESLRRIRETNQSLLRAYQESSKRIEESFRSILLPQNPPPSPPSPIKNALPILIKGAMVTAVAVVGLGLLVGFYWNKTR